MATTASTEALPPLLKDQESPSPPPPAAAGILSDAEVISSNVSDTVDAPVGPFASLAAAQETPVKAEEPQAAQSKVAPKKEEVKIEDVKKLKKEEPMPTLESAVEAAATVAPVKMAKEETAAKATSDISQPPPSVMEPATPQTQDVEQSSDPKPEPTSAEIAEPPLPNGLPQETEELSEDLPVSDTTPHDKPDPSQSQEPTPVATPTLPAQEKEGETGEEDSQIKKKEDAPPASVSCPEESTMQGELSSILHQKKSP